MIAQVGLSDELRAQAGMPLRSLPEQADDQSHSSEQEDDGHAPGGGGSVQGHDGHPHS